MKIAHIGNLANLGFLHCFFLQKAGIDAHLFVNDTVKVFPIPYEDCVYKTDFDWVHRIPRKNIFSMIKNQYPLSMELSKYDLVHSWTCSLLPPAEFALSLKGKKYFAYATGSDLREAALRNSINGFRIRRHFQNAAYVAHTFDDITCNVAEKLKLKNCGILKIPVGSTALKQYNLDKNRKTLFFLPSRLHFTPSNKYELVFKNNNRFLNAFARYIKNGGQAHLILLRRGTDLDNSKSILEHLNITDHITWMNEMSPRELSSMIYQCDVVVDQFNDLSYPQPGGGLTIESMAYGTPVLIGNDVDRNRAAYGSSAPNLSCSTEDEILNRIIECENKSHIRDIGMACKEWINKHHGHKEIIRNLINNYELHI